MNPPTPDTPRFIVLAAVDDSPAVHEIVRLGANFARMVPGGELHLVHVVEQPRPQIAVGPAPLGLGMMAGEFLAEARQRMETVTAEVRAQYPGPLTTDVLAGDVSREVLDLAERLKADVVLVGTHGRSGLKRMILGSVGESIVRKASCPVIVVREKDYRGSRLPATEAERRVL